MPVLPAGTGIREAERHPLEQITPVERPFCHPVPRVGVPRELHPRRDQDVRRTTQGLHQWTLGARPHGAPLQKEEVAAGRGEGRHIPSHPRHHARWSLHRHGQVLVARPPVIRPHDHELMGVQVIDPLHHPVGDRSRYEDDRERGHLHGPATKSP